MTQHKGQWARVADIPSPAATVAAWRAPQRRPVVVAVHGMEDSWQSWDPLTALLGVEYEVYALDLPWRAGNDYRWRHHGSPAHWLAEGLQSIPEPVDVLLGHSFGANAVLQYLAQCGAAGPAARVVTLVAPFYRPSTLVGDWKLYERSFDGFRQVMTQGMRVRMGARAASLDPDVLATMVAKLMDRIGPMGFLALFDQFVGTTELNLSQVPVPALVVAGDNDEGLAGDRAQALAEAMPLADVQLSPDYGHFCHVEQAEEVHQQINAFLRRHLFGAVPRHSTLSLANHHQPEEFRA
ncbi:alpha/beta fold hydrolase [Streptacidiphilus neutrinimicus]|uniref:alpha/beta fold hydrolase n=1 Tax=Streptacidiphilus neutrinimicus TaxID=105420 RepID=UPI000693C86D|nr:alpha/beta hydrolase [Streptacidiphilus neutrinimicus]